jgi:putative transposase
MYTTYKFRVKDKHSRELNRMAGAVNFVWNYCNQTSYEYITKLCRFPSAYDLMKMCSGTSKHLGLPSATIGAVCFDYVTRRNTTKKRKLKWRSTKKSLGWIPFKGCIAKMVGVDFVLKSKVFSFWNTRESIGKIRSGAFNQDSRGRWYLNLVVKVECEKKQKTGKQVGIDLGLKTTATISDGASFDGGRPFARLKSKLATAQRAKKKQLVKTIYKKVANCRKDALHKITTKIVNQYDTIFVGDVSSLKLAKTRMAGSVYDASWGMFRSMLAYKAIRLGVDVHETKEHFSTVTCSICFQRTGPSGLSALGVREWICSCGAQHDRDVNAAKNILRFGLESLKGAA